MNQKRFNPLSIVLFFAPTLVVGQSFDLQIRSPIEAGVVNKLDSMQHHGEVQYSELKRSYDSTINSASEIFISIDGAYAKIDSLQKKGLNAGHVASKLDSLIASKDKSLNGIISKVEKLKSDINEAVNKLNLPPELREKANELTSAMNKLDLSLSSSSLPLSFQKLDIEIPNVTDAFTGQSLPDIDLPNAANLLDDKGLQEVKNIDIPAVNVGDIGNQVKEYQGQMSELPKDIDGVAKLAEQQTTNILAITDVQKELGQVDKMTDMATTLQDQTKLKEQLVNEVKEQAFDHFAGQQEQLNKAMQSISKYKQKFSTVTSLNDIPKKAPNEMKGKPLIERIVPGLAFQLQKKDDDLLVDFNLYFGYRFIKRFTSGGGWNQRVGYNTNKNTWSPEDAGIYGPRIFSEYKLGKGFSPRVEVETMNTFVPPYLNNTKSDPGSRQWVWGAFVGMKKDYTLYKKIKGTAMVMLRLFDPERKSPYADVVSARFGFEFPMKKHP